jgi:hypothetical protein
VRDCWSRVSCQKQWGKGDSALSAAAARVFLFSINFAV